MTGYVLYTVIFVFFGAGLALGTLAAAYLCKHELEREGEYPENKRRENASARKDKDGAERETPLKSKVQNNRMSLSEIEACAEGADPEETISRSRGKQDDKYNTIKRKMPVREDPIPHGNDAFGATERAIVQNEMHLQQQHVMQHMGQMPPGSGF
jgi:hypothetical protein